MLDAVEEVLEDEVSGALEIVVNNEHDHVGESSVVEVLEVVSEMLNR